MTESGMLMPTDACVVPRVSRVALMVKLAMADASQIFRAMVICSVFRDAPEFMIFVTFVLVVYILILASFQSFSQSLAMINIAQRS